MMQKQEDRVIDLSLQDIYGNPINRSTANCYVVRKAGKYRFPIVYGNAIKNGRVNTAAFTNNGATYSHDFVDANGNLITQPYIQSDIWNYYSRSIYYLMDEENLVVNASVVDGDDCFYVEFEVPQIPQTGGNAILAVHEDADFLWSWHIWVWPHDLSPVEITNETGVKYNILPVNLASKYDDDGVHIKNWFYQWGRKDPMLLPSSWNSTTNHESYYSAKAFAFSAEDTAGSISQAIGNPTKFYCYPEDGYNWFGTKSYYNLWDSACTGTGNSDNDTVKTVYDPCPVGWKVPNGNTFTGLSIISSANGIVKMARYSGDTVGVGFPLSGCRYYSGGSLYNVGLNGYVWLSSATSQFYAYSLTFYSSYVNPQGIYYRAYGHSVRPVEDDLTKIDEL